MLYLAVSPYLHLRLHQASPHAFHEVCVKQLGLCVPVSLGGCTPFPGRLQEQCLHFGLSYRRWRRRKRVISWNWYLSLAPYLRERRESIGGGYTTVAEEEGGWALLSPGERTKFQECLAFSGCVNMMAASAQFDAQELLHGVICVWVSLTQRHIWRHIWRHPYLNELEPLFMQMQMHIRRPSFNVSLPSHLWIGGSLPCCSATQWLSKISTLMDTFSLGSVIPLFSGASLWRQVAYLVMCCSNRSTCQTPSSNFTTSLWTGK